MEILVISTVVRYNYSGWSFVYNYDTLTKMQCLVEGHTLIVRLVETCPAGCDMEMSCPTLIAST